MNLIEFTETQTPETAFDVGQIWRDTSDNCAYIVARTALDEYNLICLHTGVRWTESQTTLMALRSTLDSDFVRVTQPFTVTPG